MLSHLVEGPELEEWEKKTFISACALCNVRCASWVKKTKVRKRQYSTAATPIQSGKRVWERRAAGRGKKSNHTYGTQYYGTHIILESSFRKMSVRDYLPSKFKNTAMAGQLSNPGYHDLKDHISCQEFGTQSSFKCILMNNHVWRNTTRKALNTKSTRTLVLICNVNCWENKAYFLRMVPGKICHEEFLQRP